MRLLLPIILAMSVPCWGQTVTLPGEVSGGVSAFISVASTTDCETVKWMSLDPGLNLFPADLLKSTKTTVVSASKAGRYRLICWTAKGDVPSDAAQTVVIVGTPGPEPNPDPDPEPEPNPDPKPDPKPAGPYWIIIVEESSERTPETAKILADTAFLKSLTDAGHKWRVYDDDHLDAKGFAALTTHRPALIVTTFTGEVIQTVPLPKTAAEITALVKGGK